MPHALALPPPQHPPGTAGDAERLRELEAQLAQTRLEKESFEAQYTNLLGKLTAMRATVGDKLKQDAVSRNLGAGLRGLGREG